MEGQCQNNQTTKQKYNMFNNNFDFSPQTFIPTVAWQKNNQKEQNKKIGLKKNHN